MKNHPNTENQLVKENENLSRENKMLIRENNKLRSALCSITGQLEAEAEIAMEPYFGSKILSTNLKKAIEIYRDLIHLHKPSPLGRVSKQWVKEWSDKMNYCYEQLDQARYDVEDVNQYLDDSLVVVE